MGLFSSPWCCFFVCQLCFAIGSFRYSCYWKLVFFFLFISLFLWVLTTSVSFLYLCWVPVSPQLVSGSRLLWDVNGEFLLSVSSVDLIVYLLHPHINSVLLQPVF